jgi:glycosyltransferase involved in cell wall biosynthesis
MRIGFDGKVLSARAGGIGTSAMNLVRSCIHVAATTHTQLEFVIFTGPRTQLDGLEGSNWRVDTRFHGVESSVLRLLFYIPQGLKAQRIDVFHGFDHLGVPLFAKVGRYVATIHDMIPLLWPQWVTRKHRLVVSTAYRRLGRQADVIITPSEATKADVVRHMRLNPERIEVIPWGCEPRFQPMPDRDRFAALQQKYHLPERYILFVGTLEPRKNLTTLLRAFTMLRDERHGDEVKLVVAGRLGWLYTDVMITADTLALTNEVIFTGFVDDEDLPHLYRGAQLFVFPSLYEGFGLPILEAMASGVPVVTSNTASMPEVAGDAAILVNPHKPQALAEAMARVLAEAHLRQELTQKGLARARCFTWERTAQRTLEVYTALA